MTAYLNIHHLLKSQAEKNADALAILAPGRKPLSYHNLYLHIEKIVKCLNSFGITNNDRIAIVVPNGPEMVTSFLGVACCASSAPLNPAYRDKEFDFYLSDLNAKALLIQSDFASPAREVAISRGIPILEISFKPEDEAGLFSIAGIQEGNTKDAKFALTDDVALVLHTSGTTSRPKVVPLTHKNICTSANNIKTTLQLTEQDRCLNIMPLFHIHGLMAAVLSSFAAGASIVCTSGFQANHFFEWLSVYIPTWYTAVPTMHQTILAMVQADQSIVGSCSLRFIRSSSSSLPPIVMKGLEEAFNAPVIEAYGMTEASHQMASNPLPPHQRKPGTVGVAAGPEVKIMDEVGNFLTEGVTGEIVIHGENITLGYENNPTANEAAFTNGWFRTGDLGVMDEDNYLTISGRLKEIVNRGGEKIAPREVDEALLDHPDVAQAVAFAVPHPTLGEDLAAAVVLKNNAALTEKELRQFAFSRLADYKVPSQIAFVDEIPKGPTGKLQRIGLAEKLGSVLNSDHINPRNNLEEVLARIWAETLKIEKVGIHDNFFSNLGGDSLSAAFVMSSIEEVINKQLPPEILFKAPTIDQLVDLILKGISDNYTYLIPMQPKGNKSPIFLVPGHGGDVFTYVHLIRHLDPEQPVYVFRFPKPAQQDDNVANSMVKEIASLYIEEMRTLKPVGPYNLGGFCYGGHVIFEMAQQLQANGQDTSLAALIYVPLKAHGFKKKFIHFLRKFIKIDAKEKMTYLTQIIRKRMELVRGKRKLSTTHNQISASPEISYIPKYYSGRINLINPIGGPEYYEPYMGWKDLADDIKVFDVPGNRETIFKEPDVQVLAEKLTYCLDT